MLLLFPVLFSFGIGLGYMLKTGDISTAWTISSYVVAAAGGKISHSIPTLFGLEADRKLLAIAALLAILGSLKER